MLRIESEGYVAKLLDVFHICEDLENVEGLHSLYNIFKAFFLFNNATLLQVCGLPGWDLSEIPSLTSPPSSTHVSPVFLSLFSPIYASL